VADLAVLDSTDTQWPGTLRINARVLERIVAKAAADTPAVIASSEEGLTGLVGRQRPTAHVNVAGKRVRARVDIDVLWPQPLADVAAAVRGNVAHRVSQLTGLDVAAVDVHVADAATAPAGPGRRLA
jgi:uncharacterized alkaline shock family protein YloU